MDGGEEEEGEGELCTEEGKEGSDPKIKVGEEKMEEDGANNAEKVKLGYFF